MIFNKHLDLKGQHAFLSPSKYHWIYYDEEKIANTYSNYIAVQKGTAYHELAAKLIELGEKLPRKHKTLNMYVNDAIGYKMEPEQVLKYSDICFGTADAICFRDNLLRIHDLKTGVTPVHMEQLYIYAALFCLEYNHRPGEIDIETRLYFMDDIIVDKPGADIIAPIMDQIILADKVISRKRKEELS